MGRNWGLPVQIDPMGESALLVTLGQGISEAANERVLSLANAIREESMSGISDLAPAYSTLLVRFDPLLLMGHELSDDLRRLAESPSMQAYQRVGRNLTVPVLYGGQDGVDMDEVGVRNGLTAADIIRLHTGRPYRVFFLGFMPGFPYMARLARRLHVPRRPAPRVRVPAGSVAITGMQTGIYPFASPGGWQIIGRTQLSIWDPRAKEPSYFRAGDIVQFQASVDTGSDSTPSTTRRKTPQRPVFEVLSNGGLSTVQDLGRTGCAQFGLGPGGAFDATAMRRANALVGNSPGAAAVEMALGGPTLLAVKNTTIALDGADFGCKIDGVPVAPGMSWFVRAGTTLRFTQSLASSIGARSYMAVSGGIDVPLVLGSSATYLPGGFGGMDGGPLRVGDVLESGDSIWLPVEIAGRMWLGRNEVSIRQHIVLRYTRFRGREGVPALTASNFVNTKWLVSDHNDRMGTRLIAEPQNALQAGLKELVSFGVVRGAIQLPPDGHPIVLGPDHQTTGGYPLVGVVIQADWPILAQLKAGDRLSFAQVSMDEALTALRSKETEYERCLRSLQRARS